MEENQYLTKEQVAAWLKVSQRTIDRWIENDNFPVKNPRLNMVRFDRKEVQAWMDGTYRAAKNEEK